MFRFAYITDDDMDLEAAARNNPGVVLYRLDPPASAAGKKTRRITECRAWIRGGETKGLGTAVADHFGIAPGKIEISAEAFGKFVALDVKADASVPNTYMKGLIASDGPDAMPVRQGPEFIDATESDISGSLKDICAKYPNRIIYRVCSGCVLEGAACTDADGLAHIRDDCATHFDMDMGDGFTFKTVDGDPHSFIVGFSAYIMKASELKHTSADAKWIDIEDPEGSARGRGASMLASFAVSDGVIEAIAKDMSRKEIDMRLASGCADVIREISALQVTPVTPRSHLENAVGCMLAALQLMLEDHLLDAGAIALAAKTKATAILRKREDEAGKKGQE